MFKKLDSFIEVHRQGSHCASLAIRTILNGYGYKVTEDFCLGLGAGLGFTYQKYADVDYYFFTGRNESLEENLSGVIGARIETGSTNDSEQGWYQVKEYIDADIPVILQLDMMFLPYLVDRLNMKKAFHFGSHNAILVGYDMSRNVAFLLDYLWNEVKEVKIQDLRKARNSEMSPIKPKNKWKVIIPPTVKRNFNIAIHEAIEINIHRMKEPFAFKMGLPGLKMFVRELLQWKTSLTEDEKVNNAYMASMLFERVGTGGGNFRRMYARFLNEAYLITRNNELKNCSQHYMELFKVWRNIIRLFEAGITDSKAGIYSGDSIVESQLNRLVELEYEAIYKLEKAINNL